MGQQPVAQRALLELALQDIVSVVRASRDRNRMGDGRPGAVYLELAEALGRFDRLGGFEALRVDLWRDEVGDVADSRPPAGSGAVRSGSDAQQSAGRASARLVPARSGRDRTPRPPLEVPGG